MQAQLSTHVANSYNFYPPKVYNLSTNFSAVDPGSGRFSSTWPFYLESYTAAAAIQAGYLEDGLDLIRHIGLVNLRLGLGWAQNLWRPGFVTYVTAPVTWFVPDVLGGFGLDVANNTLYLAPALEVSGNAATRLSLPMFFPSFWAMVDVQKDGSGGGSILLRVIKSYGTSPVVIDTIVAQPIGRSSEVGQRITLNGSFTCTQGSELSLDAYWSSLINANVMSRVLPSTPPGGGGQT